MIGKVNSIHGNNRDVKDLKKKWNNLKGAAKSHVDSSRRGARQTGGGPNVVGEIDDEAIVILAADKDLSTTATERITEMLEGTQHLVKLREVQIYPKDHQIPYLKN